MILLCFFFSPCACIFFSLAYTRKKKRKQTSLRAYVGFHFFFPFTSVALFFFLTVDLSHHLSRHFFFCGYYNCSTSSWGSNRKEKKRKQRTICVFLGEEEEGRQVGGENADFFFWFRRPKMTMTCQVVFGLHACGGTAKEDSHLLASLILQE